MVTSPLGRVSADEEVTLPWELAFAFPALLDDCLFFKVIDGEEDTPAEGMVGTVLRLGEVVDWVDIFAATDFPSLSLILLTWKVEIARSAEEFPVFCFASSLLSNPYPGWMVLFSTLAMLSSMTRRQWKLIWWTLCQRSGSVRYSLKE